MEIVKTLCFVIVIVCYTAFDTECSSEPGGGQNATQSTTNFNVTTVSTEINRNTTIKSKASINTAKPDSRKDKPTQTMTLETIILSTTLNDTGTTTISEVASPTTQTAHNGTIAANSTATATKPTATKVIVPAGDDATTPTSLLTPPNGGITLGKTNKDSASTSHPTNPILRNTTTKGQDTVTSSTAIQNLATPASATANPGGIAAGVILGIAALFILLCVVRRRLRRNRRDDAMRRSLFNNPIRFEEDTIL